MVMPEADETTQTCVFLCVSGATWRTYVYRLALRLTGTPSCGLLMDLKSVHPQRFSHKQVKLKEFVVWIGMDYGVKLLFTTTEKSLCSNSDSHHSWIHNQMEVTAHWNKCELAVSLAGELWKALCVKNIWDNVKADLHLVRSNLELDSAVPSCIIFPSWTHDGCRLGTSLCCTCRCNQRVTGPQEPQFMAVVITQVSSDSTCATFYFKDVL